MNPRKSRSGALFVGVPEQVPSSIVPARGLAWAALLAPGIVVKGV
jgi:hypothetical protein